MSWERPGDTGELASLLSTLPAAATVLPTGSPPPGASEASGSPLAVSTAALSGVRELVPEELIVTVGSGTRLDALRDELAGAGTWLAVGPEAGARSAGGAVAAASPGPWDAAYGD
ncbi:MAG: FAD-binding protein, partial [Gemmatimonadota bacterium]